MQVNLDIFTIFVDYADFYVNAIMLTEATAIHQSFIIFNYFQYVAQNFNERTLYIVLKFLFHFYEFR